MQTQTQLDNTQSAPKKKEKLGVLTMRTLEKTQSCICSLWTVPEGDPLAVRWSGYMYVLFVVRPYGPSWRSEAHPGTAQDQQFTRLGSHASWSQSRTVSSGPTFLILGFNGLSMVTRVIPSLHSSLPVTVLLNTYVDPSLLGALVLGCVLWTQPIRV